MKKIRLIAGIAIVVMLCCLLALSASAKWWDDNPFTDVKSTSWYYDAVRICNENGLFGGMSETTFATSTGMTRSMFVTVLAAADENYDESQYTKSSFSDIREGSWYLAPAEWANSIGIAKGTGNGIFAPKNTITRQELALMLYKYAEYKGKDVSLDGSVDLKVYPDNSAASSWATTALEWSVQNGLISGVASGNEVVLSPKGTATRAMVAQIMVNYLALDPVREINGNDISLYQIVYNANEIKSVANAANELTKYIEQSIGVKLPVVTDEAEVTDYEILVGRTNREEMGLVTVELEKLEDDQDFICKVQGNRLVLYGIDTDSDSPDADRSTVNINGSGNAVYYFLEKEFGLNFYYEGEGTTATPDPVISLDDGYTYIDGPEFETRQVYMHDLGEDIYLSTGYYAEWGCGLPHQLGNLITGAWRDTYDNTWDTPCLTDPDNIASLLKNIRELLEEKPDRNLVGIIQNDSGYCCMCDTCVEAYRIDGSRCGALVQLCNIVCEEFEEDYPEVRFATWAYGWSAIPPKTTKLHENMIVYYNTLGLCVSHPYNDTTCKDNKKSEEYIRKWGSNASKLYLWDHSGCFVDAMTPFTDLDVLRINANYFYENNVEGAFLNSMSGRLADFCELRSYLFARLYRKPQMTEEEYQYHLNGFLKAYYGDGWQSIRSYIDVITELANENCHDTHSPTYVYYNYENVRKVIDKLDGYWDKAESLAANERQLEDIRVARLSWIYLRQCALFETMYENGTAEDRAVYTAANQQLHDDILKYDLHFSDHNGGDMNFVVSASPENWVN